MKYICNECNGNGKIIRKVYDGDSCYLSFNITCPKCFGYVELDWIEMILGKNIDRTYGLIYAPYIPLIMNGLVKDE